VFALAIHSRPTGLHLPALGLWLDARRPCKDAEAVFISHAHSDHIAAHREVILTEATRRLMSARVRGERRAHTLAFGETRRFQFGEVPFTLTLHPAGHVLGSAMALIEAAGERLLYTGDFQTRPHPMAGHCDPAGLPPVDVLVMETTFGRPEYQMPPVDRVLDDIIAFCREALGAGAVPLLQAYSLGKSQELLAAVGGAGLPVALHCETARLTRLHEELGCRFPPYEIFAEGTTKGRVLIFPPGARLPARVDGQPHFRTAAATGWALDRAAKYRLGVDAAFPLSDHADFPALVEFVRRVKPQRVFTTHGFAADFAWTLRDLGFNARTLDGGEQLTLALPASLPVTGKSAWRGNHDA